MFHDLGRTLTIHYFEDEYQAIVEHTTTHQTDELTASRTILGMPYFELGADVAHAWKFPESIIKAMLPLPRGELGRPKDDDTHVAFIAALANTECAAGLISSLDRASERIIKPAARSRPALDLQADDLAAAFEHATQLSINYARLL